MNFRKNVPRYLKDKQYAEGWSDGFRQCQAMRESEDREDYRSHHWDEREKAWQQQERSGRRPCVSLAMSRCQTSTETKSL